MILEPIIRVVCDDCGIEEEFPLSVTTRGTYSEDGLRGYLERWGWLVGNTQHYCPSCVDIKDKETELAEYLKSFENSVEHEEDEVIDENNREK